MYQVQVLLATYNGAKHLEEFLLSLIGQSAVEIHLLVSDDASRDETLHIVERFSSSFASTKILAGPEKGPAENFFFLMSNANSYKFKYFAFADQDDIWKPSHLVDSITRLMNFSDLPAMTFSRVQTLVSGKGETSILPKNLLVDISPQIIFENPAKGCTIVFNKKLLLEAKIFENHGAVMHDWWMLLIAFTFGKVIPTKDIEVFYRIHPGNFIGLGKSRFFGKVRKFISGKVGEELHSQIHAFHSQIVAKNLEPIEDDLLTWHIGLHGDFFARYKMLNKARQLRVSRVQSMLLRIYCLLGLFAKDSANLQTPAKESR
jgi:glycosyltransferase involved in cell wall biosynthesis